MRKTTLATVMTAMLLAGVTAGFVLWGWRPSRAAGERSGRAPLPGERAEEPGARAEEPGRRAMEPGARADPAPAAALEHDILAAPLRLRPFAADTGASPLRPVGGARAARDRMSERMGQADRTPLLGGNAAGDPRAALAAYDRALAAEPAGPAREQALLGRAHTLELLGERAQAATAWRALVEAYPQSMLAPMARRRIIALGPQASVDKSRPMAGFRQAQP